MKKLAKGFVITGLSTLLIVLIYQSNTTKEDIFEPFLKNHTDQAVETGSLKPANAICEGKSSKDNPVADNNWRIIWRDEFEGNCLDPEKWNSEDWAAEKNNELQYYTPSNVVVEDGLLKLISKKERYKGREYTSGAVHTRATFDLLYGKVEMKAKLPKGQGVFPAFWMLTDKKNTFLPEIDIFEVLGHQPNEVWMVLHALDHNGILTSDAHSFSGPDFSEDFHIFSIEWTPKSVVWYIDHLEQFRTHRDIPTEPMYLYVNTAIGGDWPKPPDHTTVFPVRYEIDYIRVFKSNKKNNQHFPHSSYIE